MSGQKNPNTVSGISADSDLTRKWSKAILDDGYTVIPNLLIKHLVDLGLDPLHFTVLVAIEMHRWRPESAWPSQQKLADITGYSTKTIHRVTENLHDMGLINKIKSRGKHTLYDFTPLVLELEKCIGIHHKRPFVVEV